MKRALKIIAIVLLIVTLLSVSGGLIAYASITKNAEIHNNLLPSSSISTVFYDSNASTLDGFQDDYTNFEELPSNLKNAVVALEDKRFYKHKGVDYLRLLGAAKNNIKSGALVEGGSTITQQLIKNTHLTQDKTVKRKLNEIKLATKLEKEYSKDEILTMYLNVVYFGGGMFGVKDAAKGLFNKSVSALTLSECATLAAILKNPSKYSPAANIENATSRRNLVLNLMNEQGYINDDEKNKALNCEIVLDRTASYSNTQSYVLSAAYEAAQILNISVQTLLSRGYTIETYLNAENQRALTEVIGNPAYYALNDEGKRPEGLGIILDSDTAGVSAYFGSKRRNIFEFTRSYGSIVKPIFVYAPALKYNLITAATPVLDEKTDFSGYMPSNYADGYLGNTTIRRAVMTSSNVVAVKTLNMVGYDKIADFVGSMGISVSENDKNATLALGNTSSYINPLAVLGAYNVLADGGNYLAPSFIKTIYDENGKLIYERDVQKNQVLSRENAYILTDILKDTATSGTAKGLSDIGFEVASKTGTVGNEKNNTDAYNVGYTTKNVYMLWHGNSTGDSSFDLSLKETGGSYATKAAREVLKLIYADEKPQSFTVPDGVVEKEIDLYSVIEKQKLTLATENTPDKYVTTEIFSADNYPLEPSSCFDNFSVENVTASVQDGIVNLKFDNEPYMYYEIYRKTRHFTFKLKTYAPTDKEISFSDAAIPFNSMVKYYIKPYFYNQNGEKIVGNVYETDEIYVKNDFKFYDYDY